MKLTIQHNPFRDFSFPIEEIQKCHEGISITVNKTDMIFVQEIVIELDEVDEDPIQIAYALGKLVGVIQANRNK